MEASDTATIKESPNYSIAYWFRGHERVESAKTDSETKARALLRRRLEEIGKGAYALRQEKFYYTDMVELMKADYKRKGNRSWEDVEHKIKPLAALSNSHAPPTSISPRSTNTSIDGSRRRPRSPRSTREQRLPPAHAPALLQAREARRGAA